jgi:hypothetical protein
VEVAQEQPEVAVEYPGIEGRRAQQAEGHQHGLDALHGQLWPTWPVGSEAQNR